MPSPYSDFAALKRRNPYSDFANELDCVDGLDAGESPKSDSSEVCKSDGRVTSSPETGKWPYSDFAALKRRNPYSDFANELDCVNGLDAGESAKSDSSEVCKSDGNMTRQNPYPDFAALKRRNPYSDFANGLDCVNGLDAGESAKSSDCKSDGRVSSPKTGKSAAISEKKKRSEKKSPKSERTSSSSRNWPNSETKSSESNRNATHASSQHSNTQHEKLFLPQKNIQKKQCSRCSYLIWSLACILAILISILYLVNLPQLRILPQTYLTPHYLPRQSQPLIKFSHPSLHNGAHTPCSTPEF